MKNRKDINYKDYIFIILILIAIAMAGTGNLNAENCLKICGFALEIAKLQ